MDFRDLRVWLIFIDLVCLVSSWQIGEKSLGFTHYYVLMHYGRIGFA